MSIETPKVARPLNQVVREMAHSLPRHHCHKGVGTRIRQRREELGLSQRDISFWRCSYAYVSRLECGDREPSLQVLKKLSILLMTTPEWLAFGIGNKEVVTPPALRFICGEDNNTREKLLGLLAELRRGRRERSSPVQAAA